MSSLPARLVFVTFIGLTGFIIYNALYLQHQSRGAGLERLGSGRDVTRQTLPPVVPDAAAAPPDASPLVTGATPPKPAKAPLQEASPALVTAVQRELAARGYSPGPADGVLTEATAKAISAYQKASSLPQTGLPTDALLRHIVLGESVDEVQQTSSVAPADKPSPTVKAVQQVLADLGYAPGPVDGMMGQNTKEAILAFQKDRKIAKTGQITPDLLHEMERVSGRKFAGGTSYQ